MANTGKAGRKENKAASIFWSSFESLICETRQNHERPRYYHAVCMPFAVVECGATYRNVAIDTVVISPDVVPAGFDFSLNGIAAEIEGSGQKQSKVQNAHNYCSEEQLSQKPV